MHRAWPIVSLSQFRFELSEVSVFDFCDVSPWLRIARKTYKCESSLQTRTTQGQGLKHSFNGYCTITIQNLFRERPKQNEIDILLRHHTQIILHFCIIFASLFSIVVLLSERTTTHASTLPYFRNQGFRNPEGRVAESFLVLSPFYFSTHYVFATDGHADMNADTYP